MMPGSTAQTMFLGPFPACITENAVRMWLYCSAAGTESPSVFKISLHESISSPAISSRELSFADVRQKAQIAEFQGLNPDTTYFYKLYRGGEQIVSPGLQASDQYFVTLPREGNREQLDFLVLSCHNPTTVTNDGMDGYRVWARIPNILEENKRVRFLLFVGDQVYADEAEAPLLKEADPLKREDIYFSLYEKFWSNPHYRKVLCRLPAYMMWDDHDIMDGWGSRDDSFQNETSSDFKPEWKALFESARNVFRQMQATRNPTPLSPNDGDGFDYCFHVGRAAFLVPDLRSNRNVRMKRMWSKSQFDRMRSWLDSQIEAVDTVFFVSSVVFSHGSPEIENAMLQGWPSVLRFVKWLCNKMSFQGEMGVVQ